MGRQAAYMNKLVPFTTRMSFYNSLYYMLILSADCSALYYRLHFCGFFLYRVRLEKGIEAHHLDDSNLHQFVAKSHLPFAQCRLYIVTSYNFGHCYRKVSSSVYLIGYLLSSWHKPAIVCFVLFCLDGLLAEFSPTSEALHMVTPLPVDNVASQ